MKRVKDRTVYDTEVAEQIAQYAPNAKRGDHHHLIETLYKTTDEEYFLHCEGGAATGYAKRVSEGFAAGKEIRRLTREEALDWCEERSIDGEIVVEEFGDLLENIESNS